MQYSGSNLVVCIDNTKDASIYFNEIVPLNLAHLIPWEGSDDLEAFEVLHNILPKSLLNSTNPTGLSPTMLSYVEAYTNVFPSSIGIDIFSDLSEKEVINQRAKLFFPILMERKNAIIEELPNPIEAVFGENNSDLVAEDPAFLLTGLKLVDLSNVPWRHIIEVRKDIDRMKKLRKLRTFVFNNYQGKPANYIQDDILNRLEEYNLAAKQMGLKTKDGGLKIIFNSGTLVANTGATIASILSGETIAIPISLAVGSVFLLGNISLEIRSHKRELYKFRQENPLTYLIELKQPS